MHDSYFDPKKIELRAFREQAEKRMRGNSMNKPEATLIHYHDYGEKCEGTHESYPTTGEKLTYEISS